jgi:hypothetical protein
MRLIVVTARLHILILCVSIFKNTILNTISVQKVLTSKLWQLFDDWVSFTRLSGSCNAYYGAILIKMNLYSDLLRAGRSGDRIPVGVRFSAPVQTGPGAYPASCTMGTGVKRPGHGVDHPPPTSAEVEERVELYLYSPCGLSWLVGWTLALPTMFWCLVKTTTGFFHLKLNFLFSLRTHIHKFSVSITRQVHIN